MADVLSGGSPDREPRRWRRAVIALAAALVIVGVGVLQLGRVHHRATSAPMPIPVVTLSPQATPAPSRGRRSACGAPFRWCGYPARARI